MSEKRYFIVRSSGIRFSIEHGEYRITGHQRRKPHEHGARIEYECEIPDSVTLKEAIRLYKAGVRAKTPRAQIAGKLVLADVLKKKLENKEKVRDERRKQAALLGTVREL